jgi:hypothetical protein
MTQHANLLAADAIRHLAVVGGAWGEGGPPDASTWRATVAEVARLQSEVDALRAIIESGARGREPCIGCGL